MYISNISIKNYRGIKHETLKFTRFNTLIGRNDCGKSTIINAIKLFFNDEKVSEKDFNIYLDEDKNIEIEVTIFDFDEENLKEYLVGGDKEDGFIEVVKDYLLDGTLVVKKIWQFKENGESSSEMFIRVTDFENYKIYGIKPADLKKIEKDLNAKPKVGGDGNNSDLERCSYIREVLINNKEKRQNVFIPIKNSEIKNSLPSIEMFKADQSIETTTTEFKNTFSSEVKSIINAEKKNGSKSTLAGIEEIITQKLEEESQGIQKFMSEHISGLSALIITPNFSWEKGVEITDVGIKLDSDKKIIPLENKGSGYRRLFMVARLRYLADKKQSENVIYLVEEPETFLHPSAQEEMLQSLISLSDSNQIFISTHSPIFTGATKQNAITLCRKEDTELKYEQREDDSFLLDIAKQLGVKPSHNILDPYETIIFVEGSNDREFLKIASEKLNKNLHILEQSGKIAIIEGGGGSLNNFIDIAYFEKQNKKIFLIIDSDDYDPIQITNIDSQRGLNKKKIENVNLKAKFELKPNSKCFILKKKNIDTYYHPRAIERKTNITINQSIFADNYCLETFLKELKQQNPTQNIPKKNWLDLFREMTNSEWVEVSNIELENIFDEITNGL